MNYKINKHNNFIRVFRVPSRYPSGYCFGGGYDVAFKMVDWFEPYPTISMATLVEIGEKSNVPSELTPLWDAPNGEVLLTPELREILVKSLREFIGKKNYSDGYDLLCITDYGDSFIVEGSRSIIKKACEEVATKETSR